MADCSSPPPCLSLPSPAVPASEPAHPQKDPFPELMEAPEAGARVMGSGKGGCGLTRPSPLCALPLCFETPPKTLSPCLLAPVHASLFQTLSIYNKVAKFFKVLNVWLRETILAYLVNTWKSGRAGEAVRLCVCVNIRGGAKMWLPKPLDWHILGPELPNSQGEKVSYLIHWQRGRACWVRCLGIRGQRPLSTG